MSAEAAPEMGLPLEGVRVVDFTQMVAGTHCTQWLASLGAEVIRIESPKRPDPFRFSMLRKGSEPTLNNSALFVTTNLMKRSCAIDIAEPEGQKLVHELVKHSDVVVANFRPGVLEQFNMGYDELRELNPSLVMAELTGYGHHGAYAAFQAVAPNVHAFGGLCAGTGYVDGPPEQTYMTYADVVAGVMGALSILAALHHREITGKGQYLDVAMSETMISVAPELVLRAELFGERARRRGNEEEGFAPHGCYPCAGSDRWIAIATFDDAQWLAAAQVLGLTEAPSDERFRSLEARWANRGELDRLIAGATSAWDAAELARRLQEAGVAAAPSRTAEDVLADAQLIDDRYLQKVSHSELGEALLPGIPWRIEIDGALPRPMGPAPDFGEGTREILEVILGLSDQAWKELHERGIVA